VLAACVLLCAFALAPATALAQLQVDQLEVFVSSRTREASFRVINPSQENLTARLGLNDWSRERAGSNQFTDPGTVPGACSDRITLFPAVMSLTPGESQVVRVSYTGDALDSMCWSAVIVEVAPRPVAQSQGAGIAVEVRSAVKIYVAPTATRLDVRIDELDVATHRPRPGEPPADTTGNDVLAVFRNYGNVQVRAKVRVEYRTQADSVVARAADEDVPMLPNAAREWRHRIPHLRPGRYAVLIVVDFGGADLVAGQIDLEISP